MSNSNFEQQKFIDDLFNDTDDFNFGDENWISNTSANENADFLTDTKPTKSLADTNIDDDFENFDLESFINEQLAADNESDQSVTSFKDAGVFKIRQICRNISAQKGDVKKLLETARMSALCRVGKHMFSAKEDKIEIKGIDILIALIGNTEIENGIRQQYDISAKLLPYPPKLIQYRTVLLSSISNMNYDVANSGDLSDWQHINTKGELFTFDKGDANDVLQAFLRLDNRTDEVVINPSINLSDIELGKDSDTTDYTNWLQEFKSALENKPSDIESHRMKRGLENELNNQIINSAENINKCLSYSLENTGYSKVKSVISLIGPAESGRSMLAKALYECTNKLNNTQTQLLVIDCAQYVHENCVAHFTGIEPFYRTPKQGFLTYYVEQNPYSTILFKNLNQAHANLQSLVQGIIQNGYLEDITTERKVAFAHTQIIISLEDKSSSSTEKASLELSGTDMLTDKKLKLESPLAAALASYPVIKTERLKGLDSYLLCKRKFENFVADKVNLPLNFSPFMAATILIGCGKSNLPSAIDHTISKVYEQIKLLNYDYVIDHNITTQPQVSVKDSLLPKKCAAVGLNKPLEGYGDLALSHFSASEITASTNQLLDFDVIVIDKNSKEILKLLTAMQMPKNNLVAFIGTSDELESKLHCIIDCYLDAAELSSNKKLSESLMAAYAVKRQSKYNRRQTAVTLKPSLQPCSSNTQLYINFCSLSEQVSFDPEILKNPLFKVVQPKERLADVIGYGHVKDELKTVLQRMNDYENGQNPPPKGLVFEGPPGTGKTFLALAMAGESDLNVIVANASDLMSCGGVSNINTLIDAAESVAPAIVFIDEFDSIGRNRESQSVSYAAIVNTLLTRMDGAAKPEAPVLFVAATNYADKLDPALLRAGRFDLSIKFDLPNLEDRINAIETYTAKKGISTSKNEAELLAIMCEGLTHKAIENRILDVIFLMEQTRPKDSNRIDIQDIINNIYPVPVRGGEYNAKEEYQLTIRSYRLAARVLINHVLHKDVTHVYANAWHDCYFSDSASVEHFSYSYFCDELKKHFVGRAAEAVYLGNEKLATTFTKIEREYTEKLAKTALGALNISEADLLKELSNQQVHGNAESALVRKVYKDVKETVLIHWDLIEKLASLFIYNGVLFQDDFTKAFEGKLLTLAEVIH
ncbi:AAA family ATPase [Paraglaciecola sp.]|uniref:AAA family ATPase n=1 Tax=Paraglaciecola sp. TaxID=1920173 RepID=UPI00273F8E83|nr:AAA family ATPase [Paraglaciecola sp.]MDP5032373.1 AAA family ATPase [Paraglaciecola sp.]